MSGFPNIYKYKHLEVLIAIPIVLMLIGIVLATNVSLDSSLSGGITIILQTNQSINSQQLAGTITSYLHVESPQITYGGGQVQIGITNNQSLANAETSLLSLYSYRSNYSTALVNITSAQTVLNRNASNSTAQQQLATYSLLANQSIAGMNTQYKQVLKYLNPLINTSSYASTVITTHNIDNASQVAQNLYTNASQAYKNKVISFLHTKINFESFSYQEVTPTLGTFFLKEMWDIIITVFILISIIVFVVFRSAIPSIAIVFGAGNDLIIAVGAMALMHIPLGLPSIGGLLMLIGYAIDTEMLTAIRILKRREGTPEERAHDAMATGITMTGAAIASFAVLFIVSIISYVPTYYQISGVVLAGLIGDIITTWFGNTPMILLYKRSKEKI